MILFSVLATPVMEALDLYHENEQPSPAGHREMRKLIIRKENDGKILTMQ